MKKYLVLLALFVPLLVFGLNTPEVTQAPNSSRLYRTSFYLVAGNQYKFRTFSSDDTVIYVLNSSNVQVAYNDDCGSDCISGQTALNSTITYTPSISGYYYGVMRHHSNGQVGKTATIKAYNNGTLIATQEDRPLGGYRIQVDSWAPSQWEIAGVKRFFKNVYFYYFNSSKEETGGSQGNDTVMYLISGNQIIAYDDDSGAGWSSKIMRTSGSCSSGCYVLGGAYPSTDLSEGNARMIMDVHTTECVLDMNDNCYSNTVQPYYNLDYDRDGISNTLENIMGTSSTIVTGVDTDEDGLNDYIETFGTADILLPWEGSSPTLKDVFVEVDYFGRTIAGSHVDFYEDHAADIENNLTYSFQRHGNIRIHIDVDDYLGVMNDTSTTKFALCDNAPSPADPDAFYLADEKSNYFTSSRTGIYYWVVAANRHSDVNEDSSGLSCGSSGSGLGTDRIIISLGNRDFGGTLTEYSGTTIHEMGHAFMLGHNGNGNGFDASLGFAPNGIIHRSVMNYRWQMGVPVSIPGDSSFRYSTDISTTRTDLDWSYTDVVPGTEANGCLKSNAAANSSFKKACIDARPNATPTCDCTFEEWNLLELDSAGVMGMGADSNTEDNIQIEYNERPIFGLNGEILAKNFEELTSSGEKYTKLTKDKEKKEYFEERDKLMKNLYTPEKKVMLREKYIKTLKEKGLNEGQDYEIIDGSVVFK